MIASFAKTVTWCIRQLRTHLRYYTEVIFLFICSGPSISKIRSKNCYRVLPYFNMTEHVSNFLPRILETLGSREFSNMPLALRGFCVVDACVSADLQHTYVAKLFCQSISLTFNTFFVFLPCMVIPDFYTIMDTCEHNFAVELCKFL